MSYLSSRWLLFVAMANVSVGAVMAQPNPPVDGSKQTSKELASAEASYRREIAEAEAAHEKRLKAAREALIKKLEKLMIEASKAVDIKKAVAIQDRINELKNPQTKQPAAKKLAPRKVSADNVALAESITGAIWNGSKHGPLKFAANGLIETTRPNQRPWRWAAVDANTILARYDAGNIDVFVFNPSRDSVTSYHMGIPGQAQISWIARRAPTD